MRLLSKRLRFIFCLAMEKKETANADISPFVVVTREGSRTPDKDAFAGKCTDGVDRRSGIIQQMDS